MLRIEVQFLGVWSVMVECKHIHCDGSSSPFTREEAENALAQLKQRISWPLRIA